MQLTLEGSEIAYDFTSAQDGRPPLLFLHGALGVRGQFDGLRKQFPERSHIALDFPAHGESRVTRSLINCERLACEVLALLDCLQVGPVDIIGHSMGGYVGLVLAYLAPTRVNSVVTVGTKFYWHQETIAQTLAELDTATLRSRSARYYQALAAAHTASGADEALGQMRSLIADFGRWQLSEEMVRMANVPILISAGDRDAMVPVAEVMQLFGALDPKGNAVAILPATPHPLQHLPLACFEQAVRRFWEFAQRPKGD